MPDLHISSTLVSAPAATAAPEVGGGGADAFSALLAGTIAAGPAADDAGNGPLAAPGTTLRPPDPAVDTGHNALLESSPDADQGHTDPDTDVTLPAADAAAQLLLAMGVLPQPGVPRPTATAQGAALSAPVATSGGTNEAGNVRQVAQASRAVPPADDFPAAPAAAAAGGAAARAVAFGAALETAANGKSAQPEAAANLPSAPALQPAQAAAAPAPAPVAVQLSVPGTVGSPAWREEFAGSVSLLATQHISSAELHLHPAELGPVQVNIRIESGEASITCAAHHADTRAALDAALPRLREMLEANGIAVGDASVGPQSSGSDTAGRQHASDGRSFARATGNPDSPSLPAARVLARADQLVDTFA